MGVGLAVGALFWGCAQDMQGDDHLGAVSAQGGPDPLCTKAGTGKDNFSRLWGSGDHSNLGSLRLTTYLMATGTFDFTIQPPSGPLPPPSAASFCEFMERLLACVVTAPNAADVKVITISDFSKGAYALVQDIAASGNVMSHPVCSYKFYSMSFDAFESMCGKLNPKQKKEEPVESATP